MNESRLTPAQVKLLRYIVRCGAIRPRGAQWLTVDALERRGLVAYEFSSGASKWGRILPTQAGRIKVRPQATTGPEHA